MSQPTDASAVAVVEVVSDALDTPMEELPPLSHVVDLEALDTLVSSNGSTSPPSATVTFEYAGMSVVVHSLGTVYATPVDSGDDPAPNKWVCR